MHDFLSYEDIALIPEFFSGTTRSSLSTAINFGGHKFKLPVVPANMRCVIDDTTACSLAKNGYFYVMHRFDVDIIDFVHYCKQQQMLCSISLGVQEHDKCMVDAFVDLDAVPDFITVDIAHGHSAMMRDMIMYIKSKINTFVIAGNVSTVKAFDDLCSWGADAVKVGIGPGKACTTRLKTGFYSPMFSTVNQIHHWRTNKAIPIIADGGVQHNGDVAKALVAGADIVMIGGMFAQCTDSPADVVNGEKIYFGSASAENKGHNNNVEGKKVLLRGNGMTYHTKLMELEQDLQSAMSYAGGKLSPATQWAVVR